MPDFLMPALTGTPAAIWPVYASLIGGYLLGSIPFGLLLTRLFGLGDIRRIGSGNIGATNVLRTGKKGLALATLLLDGGKGAAAALLARELDPNLAYFAAGAAFLGHLFPVWLRFKGGKGVATFLGIELALFWPLGLLCCVAWFLTALTFRFSSLAALAAAALAPLAALLFGFNALAFLSLLIALLIFQRHAANIRRLLDGSEPRIGQ
jgi:glycerol-3-phosphate acyltransferase PlsY